MNATLTSTLRAAGASAVFALTLLAFCVLTIVAMAVTPFSDSLSLFFFDLFGHTFPFACPNTVEYTHCVAQAHGWNTNWSLVVWGVVALGYGAVVRNRPLRQRVVIAFVLIPAVILLMQLGMAIAGYSEYSDYF